MAFYHSLTSGTSSSTAATRWISAAIAYSHTIANKMYLSFGHHHTLLRMLLEQKPRVISNDDIPVNYCILISSVILGRKVSFV